MYRGCFDRTRVVIFVRHPSQADCERDQSQNETSNCGTFRGLRWKLRLFGMLNHCYFLGSAQTAQKIPSNLEEEFSVAVIAHSATNFDRPKDCIHHDGASYVSRKVRWLRPKGKLICLSKLYKDETVNRAAQQRGQVLQVSDVST